MIEITKAYKTEDGQTFPNIHDAQLHELLGIVDQCTDKSVEAAIAELVSNADKVIAILKLKPRKPRTSRAKKKGYVKQFNDDMDELAKQSKAKPLITSVAK